MIVDEIQLHRVNDAIAEVVACVKFELRSPADRAIALAFALVSIVEAARLPGRTTPDEEVTLGLVRSVYATMRERVS